MFNFITFAQPGKTVNTEEFFYLQELDTCNLDLDMAVFSACETAVGAKEEGEGDISLARGLARAGVRSLVATLWPVFSQETAKLMPMFYESLTKDDGSKAPKDQALAEAKRNYILSGRKNGDPRLWAGVILIGSTETIDLAKPGTEVKWWAFMIMAALGVTVAAFWLRRRRTRNVS